MPYFYICEEVVKQYAETKDSYQSMKYYLAKNESLLNEIYFSPKKIGKDTIEIMLKSDAYLKLVEETIHNLANMDLGKTVAHITKELGEKLLDTTINKKVYVILGFNTTTIYSTNYQGEEVTVLLLESTRGLEENIRMLLAHEYTHWIREKIFSHNIFETCIGERFISEGIACCFSEEEVPNQKESKYCIVPEDTITWVRNHQIEIKQYVEDKLTKNGLMAEFFYMFFKPTFLDMPVRSGYVYGYLVVKEYLKNYQQTIQDIIRKDWKEIYYSVHIEELQNIFDEELYTMLDSMPKEHNGFINHASNLSKEEFTIWLTTMVKGAKGIDLPKGYVPQIIYIVYQDKKPIGILKLRYRLTESLKQSGGNISIAIDQSEVSKGFGSIALNQGVDILFYTYHLDRVLITIREGNIASRKMAEKNQFYLVEITGGICKYWRNKVE